MIRARVLLCIFFVTVFTSVAVTQESSSEKSSKPSESATAKAPVGSPDRVVIKVGGVAVTREEFESGIGDIESGGDPDKGEAAEKDRRSLGEDYASVLMLSQLATANHMDQSPEIQRQLALYRMQILSDAQFSKLMEQAKPTTEEISQYYSSHGADFDRVKVRRLFIWKIGEGSGNSHGLSPQDARARADAILQASAAGGDANKLAEAFKGSDTAMLDSEPVIFVRGVLPPKLETVAFSLKPGQWGEGDDTPNRLVLLQLTEHDRRPLTEVSSIIQTRLQNQRVEAKLDELKKQTGFWMDQQYFGTAVATVPREQRPDSHPPSTNRKSADKTGDN